MRRPRSLTALVMGAALLAGTVMTGTAATAARSAVVPPAAVDHRAGEAGDAILPPGGFLSAMTGGNTVGAPIREAGPRADGFRHIDTPAMIERLQQLNVTMYTYGIWDMETDWDDLRLEFAPAAEAAGIDIMVYIVPPSECWPNEQTHLDGRCSRPYNMDYVAWANAIAELSVAHPNVKSWGIDDFLSGSANQELFTPEYLASVRAAQDAVNPDLEWYVTLYHGEINPTNMARIEGALDGVIYPYNSINNTIDSTQLEPRLDSALAVTRPAGMKLALLVYNGRFLDGIIHPDERYAADVLRRAEPYVADGRLSGVIAYAAPVRLELHQPSWDYWGHSGKGSLSLSVSNFVSSASGSYAAASQRIVPDADTPAKILRFTHHDPDEGGSTGYQFKQVLVDGSVVWEQDVVGDARDTWIDTEIDLTEALAGKSEATLTFRLFHQTGVGWWPHDLRIDDVSATGFEVVNGGFETDSDWHLTRSGPNLQPYIDIYHPDRPTRVFNAISEGYAGYQGKAFTPAEGGQWPNLRIGPENRAMYGNGRLEFSVPADTPVPANTCASASQQVTVDPASPRYELDFWHADPYQVRYDRYFKQILIDGETVWDRDAGDWWPWFYIQGSDHQGVIDITEFVEGKESIALEYRLCTKNAVDELDIEVGFDAVSTVGLDLVNGGFESTAGWRLKSAGPITAAFDIHGPCQDPGATVVTGTHEGPLDVTGTTCLEHATVDGPVTVAAGASLFAAGGTITGPVRATDAESVVVTSTDVGGPVSVIGGTGEIALDHLTVEGPLRVTGNDTAPVPIVVSANTVAGTLTCTGNAPVPTDLGWANTVSGRTSGQCGGHVIARRRSG